MDSSIMSSIRNRAQRSDTRVNLTDDIPQAETTATEPMGNTDIPNGNTGISRQSTFLSRVRDVTENDESNGSDTGSVETVVRRNLRTWDVAALIINKMVGTGIFTTPGVILSLTGNKAISIALWLIGGLHTILCLTVYLEFGAALPYNGGELIYLDEMYYRPELLATILFSGFFICFGTSASNSIAFARYTVLAAELQAQHEADLDRRLIGFVAVTVNFLTCLLLYFSNGLALILNRISALYKICLLLAFFIAGCVAGREQDSGVHDFQKQYSSSPTQPLSALVYVLFAYQGWENANYVAGEIKVPKKTLRNGAFLAVFIVTTLYILVTVGLYLACNYFTATDNTTSLGPTIYVAERVFGGSLATKIAIAICTFGNMVAVAFTSSKVKQAIAAQRIIPFYRYILKNDKQFGTPAGALVLHCIFTTVMIIVTIAVGPNPDGYNLVLGIFTYGHIIISSLVGASTFWIQKRLGNRPQGWKPAHIKSSYVRQTIALLFIGLNIVILVEGGRAPGSIPRYWLPAISGISVAASLAYWGALRILMLPNPFTKGGNRNDVSEESPRETVGQALFGTSISILYENDSGYYRDDIDFSTVSQIDRSRRTILYKIDENGLYATVGRLLRGVGNFLANYL